MKRSPSEPRSGLIEDVRKELANEGCVAVDDYPVPVVQLCFHTGSVADLYWNVSPFCNKAGPLLFTLHRERTQRRRTLGGGRIAAHEQHVQLVCH